MIDHTIIATHLNHIQIRPNLAKGLASEFETVSALHPAFEDHLRLIDSGKSTDVSSLVSLQLHPGLVLQGNRGESGYELKEIDYNPGKVLRGHNGVPVTTVGELTQAQERAMTLMRHVLVDPDDAEIVFPDAEGSSSYYRSIELPFQVLDPDRSLHAGFRHFHHPRFQSIAMWMREQTHTWKGSVGHELIAYQKDSEMAKLAAKYCSTMNPTVFPETLRVETVLEETMFPDFFPERCFDEIENYSRFVRFSIQDALIAFRRFMNRTKGVFFAPPQCGSAKTPAFIARLFDVTKMSMSEIIDEYIAATGVAENTRKAIYREANKIHSKHIRLADSKIFSDEAFNSQPLLRIPALEDEINALWTDEEEDQTESSPARPSSTQAEAARASVIN